MRGDRFMTANKATFVLFAALLAARLAYFNQYARLPLLDGPLFDSQVYLAQAQAIASGSYGDPTLLAFSPLYGYFLYLFGGLNNPVGIVLLQHAMALGTLGIIWHALKRDHGAVAGLLGVMLLGGYGFLTFFETKLLSETLGILLLAAAIHIYCGYHLNSDRWGMGIAAGALFSLATLARASAEIRMTPQSPLVQCILCPKTMNSAGMTVLR